MCSYRTGMQINFSLVDICMPTWTQITHRQFTQHKSNRFLDLRISAGTFLRQLPDTLSCVSLPHPRGPHSSRLYVCCAFAFFYGSITSVYITLLVWRLHKHWIACSLLRLFFIYHFVSQNISLLIWVLVLFYFHCLVVWICRHLFIHFPDSGSFQLFLFFFFAFPYVFIHEQCFHVYFFTCFLIQISKNSCGLDMELLSYRICTFTALQDNAKLFSKDLSPVDTSKNKEFSCLHILNKILYC